ncbi:hypothetical protein SAMN05216403_10218 [Nitrosospira multiformis ATCC 25196]|uniref:Uncharacterized protein n=1 Tax=Nitrosospira multiformis (strain ATCC 25196 / NCIMB 11849 / C 71) TaxID=323848 RepID=A0A1H5S824_NITMU|nr:hypothetical protein SAMN05216411_10433 [Nitrosospira multiformis]SEF46128.1 hypothetical protein SAMN05216403_10218 [Nitrosospira multiformis ATCC 25196]
MQRIMNEQRPNLECVSLPFGFSHDSPPTPEKTNTALCETHYGDEYNTFAQPTACCLDVLTVGPS